MTDLAIPGQHLPVPVAGHASGLTVLEDWLAAAGNAQELARQLVHSFFVPQAYKPQSRDGVEVAVANATGAILLGQSLGLDPLTSLQQIYVVHGRPGMYARMKVALAQRAGHRVWEEEYSPERATWAGQRAGSDDVVRITITIEDAKRAGWDSNPAYKKTPADMLAARCSSRVVDRIAADALFGLRSVEDLQDEPAPTVTAQVTAADILSRPLPAVEAPRPAASSAVGGEGPAAGDGGEAVPAAEPKRKARKASVPPPATPEQTETITALGKDLGLTTPDSRRAYIADLIDGFDPQVGLTAAEAETVIAALRTALDDAREIEATAVPAAGPHDYTDADTLDLPEDVPSPSEFAEPEGWEPR